MRVRLTFVPSDGILWTDVAREGGRISAVGREGGFLIVQGGSREGSSSDYRILQLGLITGEGGGEGL